MKSFKLLIPSIVLSAFTISCSQGFSPQSQIVEQQHEQEQSYQNEIEETPVSQSLQKSAAELEAEKYANLLLQIPEPGGPERFPVHLRHPDLALLSEAAMSLRGDLYSRLSYRIDESDYINWYGGAIKEDGTQGMYATEAQYKAWGRYVRSDIVIGP